MMEQKGKGYQGITASEAFECENTRSDFKYCYSEKNEKLCQTIGTPRTQGQFSDKVTPNIEVVFIDEPVIQCYVQFVENAFIDVSK